MSFDSRKNLAGIGALLIFISTLASPIITPLGGGLIALIGLILMLIGISGVANFYREPRIFNNMLYGVIAGIVGVVVAVVIAIAVVLNSLTSFIYKIYPGWNGNWSSLSGMAPTTTNLALSDIAPFITAGIAVFAILFVFAIIVAILFRRSFLLIKDRSGIGLFSATGIVLLVGAILTIVLIGYLLVWIAFLLLAIAFFELRPPPAPPMTTPSTTMPPP